VIDWCVTEPGLRGLPVGCFAAGSAAAAAIMSAVDRPKIVQAIVARGGRPDLAWNYLARETAPTLLIAGERDTPIRSMNWVALQQLGGRDNDAWVVPRAGHLFLEPGALEDVGLHAAQWFTQHFTLTDDASDQPLATA
jgi:pimeloyl-ACP methyl ester carboxylesterase